MFLVKSATLSSIIAAISVSTCMATDIQGDASSKHHQIRALQPQSCAEDTFVFTGSGVVPVLGAALEYSAHICFDDHGSAVGEFFDSFDDAKHVSYHIHCAARDEHGGIYFGAEVDLMSDAIIEYLRKSRAEADADAVPASERDLKKDSKTSKVGKGRKNCDELCGCGACACFLAQDPTAGVFTVPDCIDGLITVCGCGDCARKLEEELGIEVEHAGGTATDRSGPPQGTLAILYFHSKDMEGGEPDNRFGLHLFSEFDHTCANFATEMNEFSFDEFEVAPFVSGSFTIGKGGKN